MEAGSVIDTLQTLSSFLITVSHRIGVDVVVTFAKFTGYSFLRVAEVTIGAHLAAMS